MIERREFTVIGVRDPHAPLLEIGKKTGEHEGSVGARQLSTLRFTQPNGPAVVSR